MPSRQFLVFLGVGLICALVDVGLMQWLVLMRVHYLGAASAGFALGFGLNFFLHARWTFAAPMRPRAALRFGAVVGVNYLLTMALVSLSASLIDSALVGKLAALPLIALIGFGFSKHWVFR